MPEGDTIWRAAKTLTKAIGGRTVTRWDSSLPALRAAKLVGQRVEEVYALGKNLMIRFEDGRVLRTHMRMTGSWHIYRVGERWRKNPGAARVTLEAGEWVAVCFSAPVVELLSAREAPMSHALSRLGPDILAEDFEAASVAEVLRGQAAREIGDAVLDQRLVAGIGNIYKSESLFLVGIHPRAPAGELGEAEALALVEKARVLMKANLTTSTRRTRALALPSGQRYWVYRRSGEPCLRCGARVEMIRQGEQQRSTYFCPACQPRRSS